MSSDHDPHLVSSNFWVLTQLTRTREARVYITDSRDHTQSIPSSPTAFAMAAVEDVETPPFSAETYFATQPPPPSLEEDVGTVGEAGAALGTAEILPLGGAEVWRWYALGANRTDGRGPD